MGVTTSTNHHNVNPSAARKRRKSNWSPIGVAAMVLGFMISWMVGLGVLAYILWGGRVDDLIEDGVNAVRGFMRPSHATTASSGNAAFDEYKAATLRDLEAQQAEFAEYVENLRHARDREEFEKFMKSRRGD